MAKPDPNVVSLQTAAGWLGYGRSQAYRLAQSGEFPGLIVLRKTGKRRKWLVSVPRFEQEVHGSGVAS